MEGQDVPEFRSKLPTRFTWQSARESSRFHIAHASFWEAALLPIAIVVVIAFSSCMDSVIGVFISLSMWYAANFYAMGHAWQTLHPSSSSATIPSLSWSPFATGGALPLVLWSSLFTGTEMIVLYITGSRRAAHAVGTTLYGLCGGVWLHGVIAPWRLLPPDWDRFRPHKVVRYVSEHRLLELQTFSLVQGLPPLTRSDGRGFTGGEGSQRGSRPRALSTLPRGDGPGTCAGHVAFCTAAYGLLVGWWCAWKGDAGLHAGPVSVEASRGASLLPPEGRIRLHQESHMAEKGMPGGLPAAGAAFKLPSSARKRNRTRHMPRSRGSRDSRPPHGANWQMQEATASPPSAPAKTAASLRGPAGLQTEAKLAQSLQQEMQQHKAASSSTTSKIIQGIVAPVTGALPSEANLSAGIAVGGTSLTANATHPAGDAMHMAHAQEASMATKDMAVQKREGPSIAPNITTLLPITSAVDVNAGRQEGRRLPVVQQAITATRRRLHAAWLEAIVKVSAHAWDEVLALGCFAMIGLCICDYGKPFEFSMPYLVLYNLICLRVPDLLGHTIIGTLGNLHLYTSVRTATTCISFTYMGAMQAYLAMLRWVCCSMSKSNLFPRFYFVAQMYYYLFWYMMLMVMSPGGVEDWSFWMMVAMLNGSALVSNTGLLQQANAMLRHGQFAAEPPLKLLFDSKLAVQDQLADIVSLLIVPAVATSFHICASLREASFPASALYSLWLRFGALLVARLLSGLLTEEVFRRRMDLLLKADAMEMRLLPLEESHNRARYLNDVSVGPSLVTEALRNVERCELYFTAIAVLCTFAVFQRGDVPARYAFVAFGA